MKTALTLLLFTATAAIAGFVGGGRTVKPAAAGDFVQGVSVGNVDNTLDGLSGLCRPGLAANRAYLWSESDNVDNLTFIAINKSTGATAGEWTLQGATRVDWEDAAQATVNGVSYIFIGDMGNNSGTNNDSRGTDIALRIYRCVEPVITGSNGTILSGDIYSIDCDFPAGAGAPSTTAGGRDCECMFADPDTGRLYFVLKRFVSGSNALKVYSLPFQASYSGTQSLTYEGELCKDTSATSLTIGSGSKTFTQVTGLAYPVGMTLRATSRANSANFMEGDVTAQSGTTLTVNVTTTGGSGTLTDWDISLGTSVTPTNNNGGVTGGTITPDGSEIYLTSYGQNATGAAGLGGTNLYRFTRNKRTQTIGQALTASAPQMMLASFGGGTNYPHSNPPSGPQIESISSDYDGNDLYAVGEYYATYGSTTRPLVKFTRTMRAATTVVLQNGLNGYTATADTFLQSEAPTTDNSAAASLVADVDYSATLTNTISSVASAGGGTQITVTCSAVTGITANKYVGIIGASNSAYNGTWLCTAVSSPTCTLNCAYAGNATSGSIIGHTGANGDRQVLLKFTDLSSIPAGSTIVGAQLIIRDNTEGKGWNLNRMVASWSASSTYNSLTNGVEFNNSEAMITPDAVILPNAPDAYTGQYVIAVPVATVQGWLDGSFANQGWIITGYEETTGDGFQMDSDNSATQANKPMLRIRYTTP